MHSYFFQELQAKLKPGKVDDDSHNVNTEDGVSDVSCFKNSIEKNSAYFARMTIAAFHWFAS